MENQNKAEFTKRPEGSPLVIVRSYASGEPVESRIEVGDVRDLKIESETVFVEITEVLEEGNYKGKIVSFETSPAEDYRGHKTGDTVYFEEAHVWA